MVWRSSLPYAGIISRSVTDILNWFKKKVSSAVFGGGFNNKIKRLKRMAYGYKDIDYFRLNIHQHRGHLNPGLDAANAI